ncbi:MAG: hypothetical protein ACWGSD_19420, partial [Thermodesulfobacteriota bacterium]
MKSVGETMSIGRTFKEALQKGLRGLETGRAGLGCDGKGREEEIQQRFKRDPEAVKQEILDHLKRPNANNIFFLRHALLCGIPVETVYERTGVDPWFLWNIQEILDTEKELRRAVAKARVDGSTDAGPFPESLLRGAKA